MNAFHNIDAESLRALFVIFALMMVAFILALRAAYHRGRRDFRDEHLTACLRRDDSLKHRL